MIKITVSVIVLEIAFNCEETYQSNFNITRRSELKTENKKESILMTTSISEGKMEAKYWHREWMRMTLTKHRGHGVKPLSHQNKEILSSFVRRCPYLRLASVLFPDFYLFPLLSFSFTYFYLRLFTTVRIMPSLSLFADHLHRSPCITLINRCFSNKRQKSE